MSLFRLVGPRFIKPSIVRFQPSAYFSVSRMAQADIIQDLYLKELKGYVAPKEAQKVDLPEKFTHPAAPPKPALDTGAALAAESKQEALGEEKWAPLYNPIDDPANFTEEWDFVSDRDEGFYPKRLVKPDYHHH